MDFRNYTNYGDFNGDEKDFKVFKTKNMAKIILFSFFSILIFISTLLDLINNGSNDAVTNRNTLYDYLMMLILFGISAYKLYTEIEKYKLADHFQSNIKEINFKKADKVLNNLCKKHNKHFTKGHNMVYHDVYYYKSGVDSMSSSLDTSLFIGIAIGKRINRFRNRKNADGTMRDIKAFKYLINKNEELVNYYSNSN